MGHDRGSRISRIVATVLIVSLLGMTSPAVASSSPGLDASMSVASRICVGRIDLATASVGLLDSLPGINRGIAQRIVKDRSLSPFASAQEMVDRRTLSVATLIEVLTADPCISTGRDPRADYHDLISCEGSRGVDLNTAPASRIRSALPGAKNTAGLVSARPLDVDAMALDPYSNATLRSIALAFARDGVCLSDGPFILKDGSTAVWVNPGDAFVVTHADRVLSGAAGSVADSCWASISEMDPAELDPVPFAPPAEFGDMPALTERVGDYHIDCDIATEVSVSLIATDLIGAGQDATAYILHRPVGYSEGLPADDINPVDGRVTFTTRDLSPFGWLVSQMYDDLTAAELDLCFGNRLNANYARCFWVHRSIVPWVDSMVNGVYGAGSTYDDGTRSNAFKHCILSARITAAYGSTFARELGDAHESESSGISRQMDLLNNAVGRSFGASDGFVTSCYLAAQYGGLWFIENDILVSTAPAPPPPPPGGGGLSVSFTENPFRCDGGPSRYFGRVFGAIPGETISFVSPQVGGLLPGVADSSGGLGIIWQCEPGDAGRTWSVTGTGRTSGRSVTFSVRGS